MNTSETSAGTGADFQTKEEILEAAERVAKGDTWSDENVSSPLTWAGDSSRTQQGVDPPRLGGMSRPESAYNKILKKLDAEEVSALVDILSFELMSRHAIPGRDLRQGIQMMVATAERGIMSAVDNRISSIKPSSGQDQAARQQIEIVERKLAEVEAILASRTQEEIVIMEKATNVLAEYELRKQEEGADPAEHEALRKERDELQAALDSVRGRSARIPAPRSPTARKPRKFGIL